MKTRYALTHFETPTALQHTAADWIADNLADAVQRRGTAVFMASGGRTPEPVYKILSGKNLNWHAINIGLTDERWVEAGHPASNGTMVQTALIQGFATEAQYRPMKLPGDDPFACVDKLNAHYAPLAVADIMLLGMGSDAHTLSWFAGGRGYDNAIHPADGQHVAAIEAIESAVTGPNLLRMTLTRSCVAKARKVLLLITGSDKRRVFETAGPQTPVGIMKIAAGAALTVFTA